MHSLTVLIKSNHEDGDQIENQLQIIYEHDSAFVSPINWVVINAWGCNESVFIDRIKEEMHAQAIEVRDTNYWTTEAYIIGVGTETIPSDFDFYTIEDRIRTGDLI
jgi:hypothetical protein